MPRYIIVTDENGNHSVKKVINSDNSSDSDSDGDNYLEDSTHFGAPKLPNTQGSEARYAAFEVYW